MPSDDLTMNGFLFCYHKPVSTVSALHWYFIIGAIVWRCRWYLWCWFRFRLSGFRAPPGVRADGHPTLVPLVASCRIGGRGFLDFLGGWFFLCFGDIFACLHPGFIFWKWTIWCRRWFRDWFILLGCYLLPQGCWRFRGTLKPFRGCIAYDFLKTSGAVWCPL